MAILVSAADAVAAAVEVERRGHAFYCRMREQAGSSQDRDFFAFMAKEEERHERIFGNMLERLGGIALPAGSDDEEYLAYVKGLLDFHSLFVPEQAGQTLDSPLGQALQFEKDSLLFFVELENMVPESEKEHVRACANEERKHILMLMRYK